MFKEICTADPPNQGKLLRSLYHDSYKQSIYLGGVEHFAWLSHSLLTVVLCDPVEGGQSLIKDQAGSKEMR